MIEALRRFGHPWPQHHGEVLAGHDRFAPEYVRCACNQHADAVDLQPVEALDAVANRIFVAPAHQPERRGPVEEVVFSGALPDEVPGIFRIDADGTAAVSIPRLQRARLRLLEGPLT